MTTVFTHTSERALALMKSRTLMVGLGAMKSGTSWLSEYLASHPDFYHSPVKEMNFFNQQYKNSFRNQGDDFRLYRMEEIILNSDGGLSPSKQAKLRALAQLGRISSKEEFLYYFAERIGEETHFGEISPSYSHIPAHGLEDILSVTANVKMLFLMRDPTERAASHIQHLLKRKGRGRSIDELIGTIDETSSIFLRSDYRTTLREIKLAQLGDAAMTIFYEELFCEETIRKLCSWLGLTYFEADFEKRYNVTKGERVSEEQKLRIRECLQPIYAQLLQDFGDSAPKDWRW